jgi:hypothetical protein
MCLTILDPETFEATGFTVYTNSTIRILGKDGSVNLPDTGVVCYRHFGVREVKVIPASEFKFIALDHHINQVAIRNKENKNDMSE